MQDCDYSIIYSYFFICATAKFIADDCLSASEMGDEIGFRHSWAQCCLKHFSWISLWIILCTIEWGVPVLCKISRADRCRFGLFSWLSTRSSTATCWMRSAASCCQQIVPILWLYFSRLLMLPSCQRLSGNSCNSLRAPESCLPVKFSWFYLIFTVISVSTVSQVKVAALSRWGEKIKTLVDGL